MRRLLALTFLSFCFSTAAVAQEQAPKLLRDAAQCLVFKTFLKPSTLDLGYLIDETSWPGEEVLYVVAYSGAGRSKGLVFTIFLSEDGHRQVFNIQNNAKFIRRATGADDIDFGEAPLGGIWTQEHLEAAIRRVEKQPRFLVPFSDLSGASVHTVCQSYGDPR